MTWCNDSTNIAGVALGFTIGRVPVFAIQPGSKVPFPGSRGCKFATIDPLNIVSQFDAHSGNANLALATGTACNIDGVPLEGARRVIVFDDDGYKNEEGSALERWQQEHGYFPETVTQRTPHGGMQYFFADPECKITKGGARESIHVDVRADGGYAVIAPSSLADGMYEWVNAPDEHDFAEVDDTVLAFYEYWLEQKAHKFSQPVGDGTQGHAFAFPEGGPVEVGGRNQALFSFLCYLQSRGFNDDRLYSFANCANMVLLKEPLCDREVGNIYCSVVTRYPKGDCKWLEGKDKDQVLQQFAFSLFGKNVPPAGVCHFLVYLASDFVDNEEFRQYKPWLWSAEVVNRLLKGWGRDERVRFADDKPEMFVMVDAKEVHDA